MLGLAQLSFGADSQGRIVIVPLSGFDSTDAAAPVGGNFKKTVGQQRLEVFEHAAFLWSTILDLDYDITVEVNFTPLTCSGNSATLGYAGPNRVAKRSSVWYPTALSNQIDKADTSGSSNDIYADFNSDLGSDTAGPGGTECYTGSPEGWYYGLDNNEPADQEMLLDVVLHEIGHGLGFLTFVNTNDTNSSNGDVPGALFNGDIDAYSQHLYDYDVSKYWSNMTNAERLTSRKNNTLVWSATHGSADAASKGYSTGIVNGDIKMHAPTSYASGSSISHISTGFSPNQLMEPYNTDDGIEPDLEIAMFKDIGYKLKSELSGNNKPVANSYSIDVPMNGSIDLDYLANASDADLDGIHFWNYTNEPSNGAISDMYSGTATYTPTTNFTGTDSINWLVYDDNMTVSAEGTITFNVIDPTPEPTPEPIPEPTPEPVTEDNPTTADNDDSNRHSDDSNQTSAPNTDVEPIRPQVTQPVGTSGGGALSYLLLLIGLFGLSRRLKGCRHE